MSRRHERLAPDLPAQTAAPPARRAWRSRSCCSPLLTLLLDALDDRLAARRRRCSLPARRRRLALVGGILVALGSAIAVGAADQLLLRRAGPYADVGDPDQVVALVVFVVVAALVERRDRVRGPASAAAERARAEAETHVGARRPELEAGVAARTCSTARARDLRHGVGGAEGRDRGQRRLGRGRARRLGAVRQEAPLRFDVPIGPRLRMVGRGPALFAEDQRVLAGVRRRRRTAYEGRR